jgi:hypothetical protein
MASTRWIWAEWAGASNAAYRKGMDRGQPQIPAANAQAVFLQAVKKRDDQRGVDVLEVQT